jgi:DNA-binding transcriptional MerR regulator
LLHRFPVSSSEPISNLPSSALREFTKCSKADWDGGVPLSKLLDRINRVAECLPAGSDRPESGTGRVSRIFTERAYRHYQTLGYVDAPEKHGRNASYGYRHFLQALLIRRLLTDGVPVRRMPELVSGNNDELKRMILGGVEMVLRPEGSGEAEARPNRYKETLQACADNTITAWTRIALGEGIEIHLSDKRPRMPPEQRRQMLKRIEELVRQIGG